MTETQTVADDFKSFTIPDLRRALCDPLESASLQFRGWVIENLSIDPNSNLKPWKNGTRWVTVSDTNKNKTKVCIPDSVWRRAVGRGYNISKDVSIDLALESISIDKWMQLEIEAMAVRVSGQSKLEALREKICNYCEQKGYFNRIKKSLPIFIRKIAIVTTENSTIGSDITNTIGMHIKHIADHRFDGTAPDLKRTIENLSKQDFDLIALYRGGREDEFMFVFSDPIVLDAIVSSPVPVITAIGHERDSPPVQMVADMGFASPSKFADFVRQRNLDTIKTVLLTMDKIDGHLMNYLAILESHLLRTSGAIGHMAGQLEKAAELNKHRRNMKATIAIFVLILLAILYYFLVR